MDFAKYVLNMIQKKVSFSTSGNVDISSTNLSDFQASYYLHRDGIEKCPPTEGIMITISKMAPNSKSVKYLTFISGTFKFNTPYIVREGSIRSKGLCITNVTFKKCRVFTLETDTFVNCTFDECNYDDTNSKLYDKCTFVGKGQYSFGWLDVSNKNTVFKNCVIKDRKVMYDEKYVGKSFKSIFQNCTFQNCTFSIKCKEDGYRERNFTSEKDVLAYIKDVQEPKPKSSNRKDDKKYLDDDGEFDIFKMFDDVMNNR